MPDEDLLRLLELPLIVVLDEAYIEFAPEKSRTPWVLEHDNLVIIRTFSKSAGIAGLRLGYGIFPVWLMPYLWKFKQPYNVNVAATVAGLASLRYADEMHSIVEKIRAERDRLFRALQRSAIPLALPLQRQFRPLPRRKLSMAQGAEMPLPSNSRSNGGASSCATIRNRAWKTASASPSAARSRQTVCWPNYTGLPKEYSVDRVGELRRLVQSRPGSAVTIHLETSRRLSHLAW